MTHVFHILAAAVLAIGLAVVTFGQAFASADPLTPDEAYKAIASLRVTKGTPWGGVLISGDRELLVAERQAAQGKSSLLGFSIRDVATGKELRRLRPRSAAIVPQWGVSGDGTRLVIGGLDGDRHAVIAIDVATDQEVQRQEIPASRTLHRVIISQDGRYIASLSKAFSTRVQVWDVLTGREVRQFEVDAADTIELSHDGSKVLTAGSVVGGGFFGGDLIGVAEVWDVALGRRLASSSVKQAGFSAAIFSPDGSRFLTSNRGDIKTRTQVEAAATVWDAATGQALLAIGRGEGPPLALSFSGDGSRIAMASNERGVSVWDASTGALLARLAVHGSAPKAPRIEVTSGVYQELPYWWASSFTPTFAREGTSLVTSGIDGTVKVWVDVAQQRAADEAAFTANLGQAQSGDAAAMYRLATAYRDGRGVTRNAAVSSSWLARAADAGHSPASVELGNLLVSGSGERQDCIEGGARLRKASSQGDADAGAALDAVLSPVGGRQGAGAMSPQIQADLLETEIIDVLKRSEYPAFLTRLCALEALGHAERLPPQARHELVYHRAVGLRAAGKPRAALAALTQYLNEAGNAGANYTAAIRLLRPLQEETR